MKFNFDQILDRSNDDSEKWQAYGKDVLPMWIADMDFKAPPSIINALQAKVEHGIFGYGQARPQSVLDAIIKRMADKYNWDLAEESIVFLPGLVSGMNICARALSFLHKRDDLSILTTTPVYPPFLATASNQGFEGLTTQLISETQGNILHFKMDYQGLDAANKPSTKAFMLCNPHNPSGRVFNKDELLALQALATKHDWIVISDEIHAELCLDNNQHIPYATLNEAAKMHTMTLFAPSKTFNIAGLGASFAVIENKSLRDAFKRAMQGLIPTPNYLAMAAMEAAFTQCDAWLVELNQYLSKNRDYAIAQLSSIAGLKMTKPEASYLLWLDFTQTSIGYDAFNILLKHKLALNNGMAFGEKGSGWVRLNFGCPLATLTEGITRIKAAFL